MIETEGLDEMLLELSEFGEELQQTTTTSLQEIARALPTELQAQIFSQKTSRSGTLRNSIRVSQNRNQLDLEMVYYGYYQVFGVTGTKVGAFGLPDSVLGAFSQGFSMPQGGNSFKFTKIKHPGIFGVRAAADTIAGLEDLIVNTILEE